MIKRLEQGMQQLLTVVGNRPQDTGPKIAAYQPAVKQSADEELRYLQEQVRQLRGINSEEHFNVIAAAPISLLQENTTTLPVNRKNCGALEKKSDF